MRSVWDKPAAHDDDVVVVVDAMDGVAAEEDAMVVNKSERKTKE
jgi:hypothetical protein